jgi:hypothetical protein
MDLGAETVALQSTEKPGSGGPARHDRRQGSEGRPGRNLLPGRTPPHITQKQHNRSTVSTQMRLPRGPRPPNAATFETGVQVENCRQACYNSPASGEPHRREARLLDGALGWDEGLMTLHSDGKQGARPRYGYLLLAALILVLAAALMAALWQVPRLLINATATPLPTASPAPAVTATPTLPPVTEVPTITTLLTRVDDGAGMITFEMRAEVPPERSIDEVLLWYDTQAGQEVERFAGPFSDKASVTYRLDATEEGLTRTLTNTSPLDYWWLVRDTTGEEVRVGDQVSLGPHLRSLVTAPVAEPVPADFAWGNWETEHFCLYFVPGTAAERDRAEIGALAEEALAAIGENLELAFEGQMDVYLVPRVFWQGGAAYGNKVQLISYLDRNYTSVEIWSYFTHEGTHALAQDLLQPKENGGGPDGVLVEGLAVWASNGHYRREPIHAWAAVVAASDEYIPLAELRAGPFYEFQHETSYMQAASFVQYLVETHGLERFKELYGRATGDAGYDEALVQGLYGKGYAELEADWLAYLETVEPTPEQVEAWKFRVRSFEVMRRYQNEIDSDARILPSSPPTEWMSDTLRIFTRRLNAPQNIILETALIAAQERQHSGDTAGAAALLDEVEAALDGDAGWQAASLQALEAVLELLARQDRTVLRADAAAYRQTLVPGSSLAQAKAVDVALAPAYTAYWQELVRLELSDNGQRARATILLHADVAGGEDPDGVPQLFALVLVRSAEGWLVAGRQATAVELTMPPVAGD